MAHVLAKFVGGSFFDFYKFFDTINVTDLINNSIEESFPPSVGTHFVPTYGAVDSPAYGAVDNSSDWL